MLASAEVEKFLDQGYVVLEDCFSEEAAEAWVDRAWGRIGFDRDDPTTWAEKRVHLSSLTTVEAQEFAPRGVGRGRPAAGWRGPGGRSRGSGATA